MEIASPALAPGYIARVPKRKPVDPKTVVVEKVYGMAEHR